MTNIIPTVKEVLEDIKLKFPEPTNKTVWQKVKEDPDFLETVLLWIADGETVKDFAKATSLNAHRIRTWLRSLTGEDKARYEDAMKSGAAARADNLTSLNKDIKDGKITPAAAKQVADNEKWIASKQDPKEFGEHNRVDVNINSVIEMHLAGVKQMATMEADNHPAIEGQSTRIEEQPCPTLKQLLE